MILAFWFNSNSNNMVPTRMILMVMVVVVVILGESGGLGGWSGMQVHPVRDTSGWQLAAWTMPTHIFHRPRSFFCVHQDSVASHINL